MHTHTAPLLIVGDIGVDLVMGPIAAWPQIGTESIMERSELRAGGSAGNAALAVRHLGRQAHLISAVGHDDFGNWLAQQFHGLQTSLQVCDTGTTVSVGIMHACGERSFFTTRGHLEHLSVAHVQANLPVPQPTPTQPLALLSGVFLAPGLRPHYPALLATLKAAGYQVALDTGWPPSSWDAALRAEVSGWLAHCDHLLINELEAKSIADIDDLDAAMAHLRTLLAPSASLVVKAGPRGAIGLEQGAPIECSSRRAAIFDTIGAGDAFNAGYLLARQSGAALAQAMQAGCDAAFHILSRFPRGQIKPGELAACAQPASLSSTEAA
ncbi:carbohydrate kinase family protein [Roseateles koreensis]|uniref:Carbohydrate kinase family protein n=1 Tax=Roseateles koreensis TaxID=2987526 RepID=A0ABT5KMS7_9BURK|nr:carbohydrate kinase family protein [Roseateles koreensis]MDC8784232.1 carbohydrate kinase family protein [Roseateles koreensis]